MSNIDLKALRDVAFEAFPGQWHAPGLGELHDHLGRQIGVFIDCDPVEEALRPFPDLEYGERLAKFVAHANPVAVIALIDRLEAAEAYQAETREMATKHGEVLQQIGTALGLPAGADLHMAAVPAVHALAARAEAAEKERDELLAAKMTGPADVTVTMQDGMFLGQLTDAMNALEEAGIPVISTDGMLLTVADQVRSLAGERDELRKEVTVPASNESGEQDWSGMSGAVAWHLIERHAGNWAEVGQMMDAWAAARAAMVQEGGK